MKTSSCKAKGRKFQQQVRDAVLATFPELQEDDVRSTPMGCTGSDLMLSPKAKSVFNYDVECKNQEKISIWECLKQLDSRSEGRVNDMKSILFFTRNRNEAYVCLKMKDFFEIIQK